MAYRTSNRSPLKPSPRRTTEKGDWKMKRLTLVQYTGNRSEVIVTFGDVEAIRLVKRLSQQEDVIWFKEIFV